MSKQLPQAEIARMAELYASGKSLPEVGAIVGRNHCTVRYHLHRHGIPVRSRADGIRLATPKIAASNTGKKKPPFTAAHKELLRQAKLAHGEKYAKGTRVMPDGYIQFTRGPHKGRLQHVVVMEEAIGGPIPPGHDVHHDDENRQNNNIANLRLLTRSDHQKLHRKREAERGEARERDKHGRFT